MNTTDQQRPLERQVGLTNAQLRVVELMRASNKHELYQTMRYTDCALTYSGDLAYRLLSLREAEDLVARGIVVAKWPNNPKIKWWVLPPNAGIERQPQP